MNRQTHRQKGRQHKLLKTWANRDCHLYNKTRALQVSANQSTLHKYITWREVTIIKITLLGSQGHGQRHKVVSLGVI